MDQTHSKQRLIQPAYFCQIQATFLLCPVPPNHRPPATPVTPPPSPRLSIMGRTAPDKWHGASVGFHQPSRVTRTEEPQNVSTHTWTELPVLQERARACWRFCWRFCWIQTDLHIQQPSLWATEGLQVVSEVPHWVFSGASKNWHLRTPAGPGAFSVLKRSTESQSLLAGRVLAGGRRSQRWHGRSRGVCVQSLLLVVCDHHCEGH